MHFRGIHWCTINTGIEVNGQHVNISSSAVHLGQTISSVDRSKIVKSAINNFGRHFNMFMSNFSSLSASMRNALFNQFCCILFYGSPLWLLKSGSVQSLCVNWRKHIAKNMPLILNLEKILKKFIVKNLSCSNPLVSIISKIALSNPMSDTSCNYRNLLYCNSELNVNQSIVNWNMKQTKLHNTIITLYELIDIRDGAQECIGFTHNAILTFIMNICTN